MEWAALLAQWITDYDPQNPTDRQIIERTAKADWNLRLAENEEADERRLERMERVFLRWHRVAEQIRRARLNERLRLESHEWRRPEPPEPEPVPAPRRQQDPLVRTQWIEVDIRDGKTVTVCNPPLESMGEILRTSAQPQDPVRRILNIPFDPLPPEYDWARTPEGKPDQVIRWRCTAEECLEDLARDLSEGGGHVVPSRHMLRPGEKEFVWKKPQLPSNE